MARKVEIYSTPTCGYCNMAKEFFKSHDVDYTEYNVAEDPTKRQDMVSKSGQMGVPVIVVTDEDDSEEPSLIVGFNEPVLRELLSI